ncbi:MAG: T9SS type A sorting domain-containing protein [Chitinophagaceae bacterium]|nr:T9SS type A sorting domain-containing protein [Chitinophagaceae bacterium]
MSGSDDKRPFKIYPVPCDRNEMTAEVMQVTSGIASFELRNLIGRRLQLKTILNGDDKVVFLNMLDYPEGIYVIIAKNAEGKLVATTKFIIER